MSFSEYFNFSFLHLYNCGHTTQGVWSLDDYQFVSFIWGAAQFTNGNDIVSPSSISDYEKAENMKGIFYADNKFTKVHSFLNQCCARSSVDSI